MKLASRNKTNPYRHLETVTAAKTFVAEDVTIVRGEKRAGSDPVVERNWGAFLAGDLQPHQLPNPWDEMLDPPVHEPHVLIPPSIPPHRQVESQVDVWYDGGFAPDSPGAKSGRPSGFGIAIKRGKIYDALSPVVRQHPDWFCWVRREVQTVDLDRLEQEGDEAVK